MAKLNNGRKQQTDRLLWRTNHDLPKERALIECRRRDPAFTNSSYTYQSIFVFMQAVLMESGICRIEVKLADDKAMIG
ncbi:hypothetical protein KP509_24G059000 [Ceratopteris richardii]|nr:hypothetical protein KP509_24G059000 [Ceratopteris richardii]